MRLFFIVATILLVGFLMGAAVGAALMGWLIISYQQPKDLTNDPA